MAASPATARSIPSASKAAWSRRSRLSAGVARRPRRCYASPMFTWPTILLTIMAVLLGVGTSFALARLFKNKIKNRQVVTGELEKLRRAELQEGLDDAGRRS